MAQQVKFLAAKTDKLTLIPRNPLVKGENQYPFLASMGSCTYAVHINSHIYT